MLRNHSYTKNIMFRTIYLLISKQDFFESKHTVQGFEERFEKYMESR